MAKNIVICCDGTNNEFGKYNTSVVRLFQCLDLGVAANQVAFYDPGVGTLAAPQMLTRIGQWLSKVGGLAIGTGIFPNVEEVIHFLMIHYQPGDRVYLFGFSRGAYTVRMVAGLLRKCGLPHLGNEGLFPYMKALYKVRDGKAGVVGEDVSPEFKSTFCIPCPIHFLGLWDTVSTVGIVWNPDTFPYTFENDEAEIVRHAIAVDERRGFFRTNRWGNAVPLAHNPELKQSIEQIWFPGVHSDVGGGYETGELWKRPFEWLIGEATKAKMAIIEGRRAAMLNGDPAQWHRSMQHDEAVKWAWRLAGFVPKQYRVKKDGVWHKTFRFSFAKWREVRPGELLHRSVIERWRDVPDYRPKTLDPAIMAGLVPMLTDATVALPYSISPPPSTVPTTAPEKPTTDLPEPLPTAST